MEKLDVKVEITVHVEGNIEITKQLESIIQKKFSGTKEYTLDIIGCYMNDNSEHEFYIVMNTKGSYKDNLDKLSHLHITMEELIEDTGMKYKGISLIPNKVKWN